MTGCQAIAEKTVESAVKQATGADVDVQGDDITVSSKDGSVKVSSGAELPADFPADVPIPDGATIETVITSDISAGTGYSVGLSTDDTPADLFDWYTQALKDAGWDIATSTSVEGGTGGMLARKSGTNVMLVIDDVEGKAEVALSVTPDN